MALGISAVGSPISATACWSALRIISNSVSISDSRSAAKAGGSRPTSFNAFMVKSACKGTSVTVECGGIKTDRHPSSSPTKLEKNQPNVNQTLAVVRAEPYDFINEFTVSRRWHAPPRSRASGRHCDYDRPDWSQRHDHPYRQPQRRYIPWCQGSVRLQ